MSGRPTENLIDLTAPVPRMVRMRDQRLGAKLWDDGFVTVPFLDATGLDRLRDLWDDIRPPSLSGIYSNVHDQDVERNRRVDVEIRRVFGPAFDALFVGAELRGASFLVKGTGPDSASTPHQDWNNVDERITQSLSVWVPLTDVDEHNGALVVIPGSHRMRPTVRSLDTPSLYLDFDDRLDPLLVTVPARAGDAVVYAHNLFHGSRPNASERIRVSAVAGAVPIGTRLVHYRAAGPDAASSGDDFDLLEVTDDFYFSGIPDLKAGRLPDTATVAGRVTVPDHRLRADEVIAAATDRAGRPATTTGGAT